MQFLGSLTHPPHSRTSLVNEPVNHGHLKNSRELDPNQDHHLSDTDGYLGRPSLKLRRLARSVSTVVPSVEPSAPASSAPLSVGVVSSALRALFVSIQALIAFLCALLRMYPEFLDGRGRCNDAVAHGGSSATGEADNAEIS